MAIAALGAIATIVGSVTGVVGSVVSYMGAKKAEQLRLKQMNLEAAREKRKTLREMLIARSQAVNTAAAAGIEGSGIQGGSGNVVSQGGGNIQAVNQAQEIGQGMFKANSQIALGQTISSIGAGIGNLAGAFGGSTSDTSYKLKTYFGGTPR